MVADAFDQHLFAQAHQAQEAREPGDYEAVSHDEQKARSVVESAAEFIAALQRMVGD